MKLRLLVTNFLFWHSMLWTETTYVLVFKNLEIHKNQEELLQHPNQWTAADSLISPKGIQAYKLFLTTLHWAVTFNVPLIYSLFVKGEDGKQKVYHFIHTDLV